MNANRTRYTGQAAATARALILTERLAIQLPRGSERGLRFGDDNCVLAICESMALEVEFMIDPVGTVDRALCEAAAADYWYTNEKGYELEDCEISDDDED